MKKILVVDDSLSNLMLVEEMLKSLQDVEIITTTNGQEALNIAKKHNIDLIILDLLMPKMNGEEVAGKLRLSKQYANIPIIVFTGSRDLKLRFVYLNY